MKTFIFAIILALSALVASENEAVVERPARCQLPELREGQEMVCLAYIPMYRFDSQSNLCVKFIYGGCLGTDNKFKTLAECVKTCKAANKISVPDKCRHEPDTGRCDALFPSFYFDVGEGKCKSFDYGGCGGNDNRFATLQNCRHECEQF